MTTYPSKIGYGILIPILLILGITFCLTIVFKVWLAFIVNVIVSGFIIHLYATTKYTVDGQNLIIKSGFLVNIKIPVKEINSVKRTRNPLSSPALSLDKIEIKYGKKERVMISPKERNKFINHLKSINPDLQYLSSY